MATETIQVPAPAMPAVAGRAATTGGASRAGAGLPPPPRRGQIKGKIIKDVVAAVTAIAAGLVKNTNRADGDGEEALPASDDACGK